MHMGVRPVVAAVVAAVLLGVVGTPTATGVEGDTTPPAIVSLTVTPDNADVTTADGVFNVTMRVTDDASTVVAPTFRFTGVSRPQSGAVTLTKAAGTDRDST